ncbi:uncharacterized protein RJT20DRAFT_128106 [Scheffersomyces xylosifermentans]|uniref:uncharacterized protein n=1 Tax=Scheffersomyces xylosifermentans TaxID=1304137 RepID=UPI00315C51B0
MATSQEARKRKLPPLSQSPLKGSKLQLGTNKIGPTTATTPASVSSRHGSNEVLSAVLESPKTPNLPLPISRTTSARKRAIISTDFKPSSRITRSSGDNDDCKTKKTLKLDIDDPIVNSEEFKFLYRMFVPNKYLIRNNKMSKKNLLNHLPLIIPTAANEDVATNKNTNTNYKNTRNNNYMGLNFQVHLFLSSIMVNYINSWYLTKLNTDDMAFLQSVYQLLSDLVKDISKRINSLLKNELRITNLIDDFAEILNKHISDLASETSLNDLKIFDSYFAKAATTNVLSVEPDEKKERIIDKYLASNHIIFNKIYKPLMPNHYESHDTTNESYDETNLFTFEKTTNNNDESELEKAATDAKELEYFRVLVKNILISTFENPAEEYSISPLTSKIGTSLVVILVSDLIIVKIFDKLSSPEFILNDIINKIVDVISSSIDTTLSMPVKAAPELKTEKGPSFLVTCQGILASSYNRISRIILNVSNASHANIKDLNLHGSENHATTELGTDIFNNSIFKLFDTITSFSRRKPLLSSVLLFFKDVLCINQMVAGKVNSICTSYISNKILNSTFISDASLSSIISDLRVNIFEDDKDKDESSKEPEEVVTIDELTNKIFDLITVKVHKLLPSVLTHMSPLFSYYDESDAELKASIRRKLVIFNYLCDDGNNNNELHSNAKLNKLLIINLFDCVVRSLYSELVSNSTEDNYPH